jgi:hypothetical protein
VQDICAKYSQAEGVTFPEIGKLDDRLQCLVASGTAAEWRHHAAGNIEADFDVCQDASVGGFHWALWTREEDHGDG